MEQRRATDLHRDQEQIEELIHKEDDARTRVQLMLMHKLTMTMDHLDTTMRNMDENHQLLASEVRQHIAKEDIAEQQKKGREAFTAKYSGFVVWSIRGLLAGVAMLIISERNHIHDALNSINESMQNDKITHQRFQDTLNAYGLVFPVKDNK